jgi:hypothetical protein
MAGPGKRGREEKPDPFTCCRCHTDFNVKAKEAKDKPGRVLALAPVDYLIHGPLWDWAIHHVKPLPIRREGILCLCCLEEVLGRPLHIADFPSLPINWLNPILVERKLVEHVGCV